MFSFSFIGSRGTDGNDDRTAEPADSSEAQPPPPPPLRHSWLIPPCVTCTESSGPIERLSPIPEEPDDVVVLL